MTDRVLPDPHTPGAWVVRVGGADQSWVHPTDPTRLEFDYMQRLADLIDVRKDDLGLALATEHGPRRGRSFSAKLRKQKAQTEEEQDRRDIVDPDGASF